MLNDQPRQWFRLCEFCGAKEFKVITGNIVDWLHSNQITINCKYNNQKEA